MNCLDSFFGRLALGFHGLKRIGRSRPEIGRNRGDRLARGSQRRNQLQFGVSGAVLGGDAPRSSDDKRVLIREGSGVDHVPLGDAAARRSNASKLANEVSEYGMFAPESRQGE